MPSRPLNPDERALWARVIATVRPLEGREVPEFPQSPFVSSEVEQRVSTSLETNGNWKAAKPAGQSQNTLDGSWDRRLSRGQVAPDIAVDLHGHSLDSAWRTLDQGLEHAVRSGARVMLLVTGKPPREGSRRGAIRGAVGDWIAVSRHAGSIAAVRGAHPRHGGTGALYIVFRRPKARG